MDNAQDAPMQESSEESIAIDSASVEKTQLEQANAQAEEQAPMDTFLAKFRDDEGNIDQAKLAKSAMEAEKAFHTKAQELADLKKPPVEEAPQAEAPTVPNDGSAGYNEQAIVDIVNKMAADQTAEIPSDMLKDVGLPEAAAEALIDAHIRKMNDHAKQIQSRFGPDEETASSNLQAFASWMKEQDNPAYTDAYAKVAQDVSGSSDLLLDGLLLNYKTHKEAQAAQAPQPEAQQITTTTPAPPTNSTYATINDYIKDYQAAQKGGDKRQQNAVAEKYLRSNL